VPIVLFPVLIQLAGTLLWICHAATAEWELSSYSTFHSRAVPSNDPVRIYRPSGLKATEVTCSPCSRNVSSFSPVTASHKIAVSSDDPVRTCRPSGLKATDKTKPVCPSNRCNSFPFFASHSLAVFVPRACNDVPTVRTKGNTADCGSVAFECP
jgi:hypothetical protein